MIRSAGYTFCAGKIRVATKEVEIRDALRYAAGDEHSSLPDSEQAKLESLAVQRRKDLA